MQSDAKAGKLDSTSREGQIRGPGGGPSDDEPRSLDSLFKEKLFRIPDYQRGYAWQREQLKAFWEDLVNLSEDRSHYTGVLTLKQVPTVSETDKEYWLVEDHSYKLYHIVDGQQRPTTFVIFLQAFVEFMKALPENRCPGRSRWTPRMVHPGTCDPRATASPHRSRSGGTDRQPNTDS